MLGMGSVCCYGSMHARQHVDEPACPALMRRVLKGDREGLRRLKLRVEDPPRRRHMVGRWQLCSYCDGHAWHDRRGDIVFPLSPVLSMLPLSSPGVHWGGGAGGVHEGPPLLLGQPRRVGGRPAPRAGQMRRPEQRAAMSSPCTLPCWCGASPLPSNLSKQVSVHPRTLLHSFSCLAHALPQPDTGVEASLHHVKTPDTFFMRALTKNGISGRR